MVQRYAKELPIAGFRITEQEQERLDQVQTELGLRNLSETLRVVVKKGTDEILGVSK